MARSAEEERAILQQAMMAVARIYNIPLSSIYMQYQESMWMDD